MATGTFLWGAAIRHHASAIDLPAFVVAQPAGDVLVSSEERKRAGSFVIEQRSGPMN